MRSIRIRNWRTALFAACFVICTTYCVWVMYFCAASGDSLAVGFLPVAYFIVLGMAALFNKDFFNNIAFLILIAVFFMRMVVYPVMVVMSGIIVRYANHHLLKYIGSAVALQVYEYIVCMAGAIIWLKKDSAVSQRKLRVMNIQGCVIFPLIAAAIFGCVLYPSVLGRFKLLFQFDPLYDAAWDKNLTQIKSSLSSGVYYLLYWFLNVMRYAVLYYCLIAINRRSHGKKQLPYLLFSFMLLPLIAIYTGNDRAAGVYGLFAYVMLLSKLYPAYEKKIFKIALYGIAIIAAIVLLLFPILKQRNYNQAASAIFSYMNYHINAYFGGTVNIAAALDMEPLKVSTIVGDIVQSIPLLPGLIQGTTSSTEIFNSTIGANIKTAAQIMPNIGLGVSYLGPLFAPIFSLILLRMGLRFYSRSKNTFQYFIGMFGMLYCVLGIVCYNLFLVILLLIQYIVPLALLEYLARRVRFIVARK